MPRSPKKKKVLTPTPTHKRIAVVSYNLDSSATLTQDAIAVMKTLRRCRFDAKLVHQWSLNEPNATQFYSKAQWNKWDAIVLCGFYGAWNLRELILSEKPVICMNLGYGDDLGLSADGEEHASEASFEVIDGSHPVMSFPGAPAGVFTLSSPIWFDSVSVHNHHVNVLVRSMSGYPVLTAHKTHRLVYFGWYRMSQATPTSVLKKILCRAASWATGLI